MMEQSIKFTQALVGAKVDGVYGTETASKISDFISKYSLSQYVSTNTVLAVRTNDTYTDKFDDLLFVRCKDGKLVAVPCSTKAGRYYAHKPLHAAGTAVIAEGVYKNSHICVNTGRFGGLHMELQQLGAPVRYYRDNNKDDKIDRTNPASGFVGLNVHLAKSANVGLYSAGCIVVPLEYWIELEAGVWRIGSQYSLAVVRQDIEKEEVTAKEKEKEKAKEIEDENARRTKSKKQGSRNSGQK
jgi:hypothetical protein